MTRLCSFFSEARRITARDYVPSDEDILRAPWKTNMGVTETYFKMGQLSLRLCHITGQKCARRRWMTYFGGVTGIIFCAPLADYDQVSVNGCMYIPSLRPDVRDRKLKNQLGGSLSLFESLTNSRSFRPTAIFLFLTEIDKFRAKILKVDNPAPFIRFPPLSRSLFISSGAFGQILPRIHRWCGRQQGR